MITRRVTQQHAALLVSIFALGASACATEVVVEGSGASNSGGNTGGSNSGGSNTGGINSGGSNSGGNSGGSNSGGSNTGGGPAVDCISAENFDPCSSPGSYCSYYDAGTNEYCDAYCDDSFHWQKSCYTEPTYCYNPSICPTAIPNDGTYCQTTTECEYYDCEYSGACGGTGYATASCQDNYWYTYQDCYCYQPSNLCPMSPPQNGTPCTTTQQCESYDCEWFNACGQNTYQYGYCDFGTWYTGGDCM